MDGELGDVDSRFDSLTAMQIDSQALTHQPTMKDMGLSFLSGHDIISPGVFTMIR